MTQAQPVTHPAQPSAQGSARRAAAERAASPQTLDASKPGPTPLLHITDLYHPPQDPDDQIDLATIAGLGELDLQGVVLDVTRRFLEAAPAGWDLWRDPGYVPVVQLGHLTGRAIPVAIGPMEPLRHPKDAALDRPRTEQAGVALTLAVLERSPKPVVISVVGSARVLAAAYNRAPELLRAKTQAVLLNAGATAGPKREWNVGLDPVAYVALWKSGLPIQWYPCGTDTGAFDPAHERGTFWRVKHSTLFHELPAPLAAWFCHGFTGSARGDIIGALADAGRGAVWENVLAGERNLWSTASLVMAANRSLARTPDGWRFLPHADAAGRDLWPWRLDPIEARVDDDGVVEWRPTAAPTHVNLFGRKPGAGYADAMAEALNALLRQIPL